MKKNIKRKKTKKIKIGKVTIGGNAPIAVQSMTKTDTHDVASTVRQIKRLEKLGCNIIRVAVPDMAAAKVLRKIKSLINIPLVADIHYDYKLALESINQGVDKIRINPGNIGSTVKVKEIIKAAKQSKIPIRIGINSGSLGTKKVVRGFSLADKMVNTAVDYIKMFENCDFYDIVLSLKASDVLSTVNAYRSLSKKTDYPLHVGITESGPAGIGTVKSVIGIGTLLQEGIGDTIRVSLTAIPEEEVKTGYQILAVLGLKKSGIEIISCPTCSRCKIDLIKIVNDFEEQLALRFTHFSFRSSIKVALMGCEVNGPGEARHADIGIAGGKNTGLLFKNGKVVRKVPPKLWVKTLIEEIKNY